MFARMLLFGGVILHDFLAVLRIKSHMVRDSVFAACRNTKGNVFLAAASLSAG